MGEFHRFVTASFVVDKDTVLVRDDHVTARFFSAIAARKYADLFTVHGEQFRDICHQRSLTSAAGRNVSNAYCSGAKVKGFEPALVVKEISKIDDAAIK